MRKTQHAVLAADFAAAVRDLYSKACRGDLHSAPEQERDVRRVAFGLAHIRTLIDAAARAFKDAAAYDEKIASGNSEALAIMDALISGRDHPIWKHIRGMRSKEFRPQHSPANGIDVQRQYAVIGLVQAYEKAAGCSRAEAVRKVVNACRSPDFHLDENLIKKSWIKNNAHDKKAETGWEAWRNSITVKAGGPSATPEQILQAGRAFIFQAWSVPFNTENSPVSAP